MNNNVLKINAPDGEQNRCLINILRENKKEYFIYEHKQNQPIKVMARGLHPTHDQKMSIEDLLV